MECAPKVEWGLFGSMYFFAVVSASLIFTPLADKYGRKPIVTLGILLQLVSGTLILFTTSRYFAMAMIFINGLAMPMRVFVGFIFCMEFCLENYIFENDFFL